MSNIGYRRLTGRTLAEYLGGRPPSPGVKYFTAINHSKKYPYSSERQNTREKRRRLRKEAA